MKTEFQAIIPAPFGVIGVKTEADYLTGLALLLEPNTKLLSATDAFTQEVVAQINTYLTNAKHIFNLPVALDGTPFQKRVWAAIQQVKAGELLTYSELAIAANSGPRAVANACGANHLLLVIPCHRIVAKNGLGGFGGQGLSSCEANLNVKRWLLNHEKSNPEKAL